MFMAISGRSWKIPIDLTLTEDGEYHFRMEYVDIGNVEEFIALDEIPSDPIDFCPFCGKNISIFGEESYKWKKRDYVCGSFRRWFAVDKNGIHTNAPTSMFKYEPRENKFYMHYRKGSGEGWIPITYCIYCGEPLAEMVEKYGIPEVIADRLAPSEWHGKYKLCTKKKVLTESDQLPDELSI
jgi:hypothetical protein